MIGTETKQTFRQIAILEESLDAYMPKVIVLDRGELELIKELLEWLRSSDFGRFEIQKHNDQIDILPTSRVRLNLK